MSRKTDYWLHDMDKPHIVALAIHGGAGGTTTPDMPADLLAAYRNRLRKVLTTTFEHGHSTSLDAVCHAVSQLEDSPLFNAGKGAVFDLAGHTVCESSLMTTQPGFNSKTVAVTGVRRTKNPILLSKVLLQNNRKLGGHAFYSGRTAEEAAWKHGTKKVSKKYYWTKRRWMEHKKGIETANLADLARDTAQESDEEDVDVEPPSADPPAYSTMAPFPPRSTIEDDHEDLAVFDEYAHLTDFLPQGTVGAVALDSDGHLSVATSTGGKTNKFPGRVGDTPSVGSGFWADSWFDHSSKRRPLLLRLLNTLFKRGANKTASEQGLAISGTGDGDFFLRTNFASSLAHRIKFGKAPTDQAIQSSMDELVRLFGSRKGVGGAIILDKQGNAYFPLAASTMNRGLISKATSFQPQVAIFDYESIDVWS